MTGLTSPAKPTPLLIFPFNGNGLEALDCLQDDYRLVGFIDDDKSKQVANRYGVPVFDRAAFDEFPDAQVLAVPGSPASYQGRRQAIGNLGIDERRFARVIHPAARISSHASIGRNVLILAGVVITSSCVIGDHVCVLPNTVIHHDVTIGDWTLIGSNVSVAGGASIGENCYIGSGTSIMNGLNIGVSAMLGLGSNVIRDVPSGAKVAGNPARAI